MEKPTCFDVETRVDDRGLFIPFSNSLSQDLMGKIKRVYAVENFEKGVIRGFHYHQKEIKIFYIVKGAAKFVAINKDNPEDKHVFVTSEKKSQVVVIPPGYANGWVSLEDGTILISLSSATFEESIQDDVRLDPYTWGDVWKVKSR